MGTIKNFSSPWIFSTINLHVMHNTLITTTPSSIFIHYMFLSSHISLRRKAVNGKMVNVLHLLLPGWWLTSSLLSGSQLKLYQKWTGKIYWSTKPHPVNQEMVARFLPSYNFSWTVSEMTGRDRGERLAHDLPGWKVMNSVECENTFLLLRTSVMV